MKEELTILEVIGLAIRGEEEAAKFYGEVSKTIKNDLVRSKYESLSREEMGHRHMLLILYRKMTGEKDAPPKIPGTPQTAEGGGIPVGVKSLEELLKLAISRERKAMEFYLKAATRTDDHACRRTFEYLADIERGHELMLKTELDAYLRDRDWYAEKPDIQLVGP